MKKILVVFGGRSAEHEVSIITAHTPIMASLERAGYDVWPCYIASDGRWYVDKRLNNLDFYKGAGLAESLKKLKAVAIELGDGLTLTWPGLRTKTLAIDIVFPAMHGTYGEDGSLMGLLRMANVPFVGCDLAASAVAMDKVLTKQVVAASGLPIVEYVWTTRASYEDDPKAFEKSCAKLGLPVFVKPVHLGSSIGITKAHDAAELANGLEVGFHYDDKVLVEKSIENLIEVTVPIIGNDQPRAALVEAPVQKTDFFDFETKYIGQGKKSGGGANSGYSQIPAELPKKQYDQAERLAIDAYRAIGGSGTARVDLLIDTKTSKMYVNEINTLPGSLYYHNWKRAGLSGVELCEELLRLAQEHWNSQQKTVVTFKSTILDHAGGQKTGE